MTDIELMRRAARAAGIEVDVWTVMRHGGEKVDELRYRGAPNSSFNPLQSGDDAFQVMVGAELRVKAGDVIEVEAPNVLHRYIYQGGKAEATRRAIVEIAACIA